MKLWIPFLLVLMLSFTSPAVANDGMEFDLLDLGISDVIDIESDGTSFWLVGTYNGTSHQLIHISKQGELLSAIDAKSPTYLTFDGTDMWLQYITTISTMVKLTPNGTRLVNETYKIPVTKKLMKAGDSFYYLALYKILNYYDPATKESEELTGRYPGSPGSGSTVSAFNYDHQANAVWMHYTEAPARGGPDARFVLIDTNGDYIDKLPMYGDFGKVDMMMVDADGMYFVISETEPGSSIHHYCVYLYQDALFTDYALAPLSTLVLALVIPVLVYRLRRYR